MEEFEGHKDTEIQEPQRWFRVQAVSHFLIGIGTWILLVIIGMAALPVLNLPFNELADPDALPESSRIALMLSNFLVSSVPMVLTAFILALVIRSVPSDYLSLNRFPHWITLALLGLLFLCIEPIVPWLLELNSLIDLTAISPEFQSWVDSKEGAGNKVYQHMLGTQIDGSIVYTLFFMAIAPAIAEELFFRGFMLRVMHGTFKNFHIANFVTSLVFAAMHFQFYKILPMIALSMTFGYMVYFSRSIWVPILVHALNNAITVFVVLRSNKGNYEEMLEEQVQVPWIVAVVAALGFVALFYYLRKSSRTKLQNLYE